MKKSVIMMLQLVLLLFLVSSVLSQSADVVVLKPGIQVTNTLDPNYRPEAKFTESLLYDNGPLVNLPGGGAGGANASIVQTSIGLTSLGFNNLNTTFRVAENFTVTAQAGWAIDSIVFYGYQTNSTLTSTFTEVYYQIWNGPPNDPLSVVVYGDLTTNRLIRTEWSNIYRASETTPLATTRPIMKNTVSGDLILQPGTYWIEWGAVGTLTSGPWVPPVSINGQPVTGDALQLIVPSTWQNVLSGTYQQGLPFEIYGTQLGQFLVWLHPGVTLGTPSAASADSIYNALVANGQAVTLSNNLFVAGPDLSIYEGIFVVLGIYADNGVILSTDPEGPALEAYLANGGRIFLEGGDCFNYDPLVGGYNIQPWFGLNPGGDGSADLLGVIGLNDLSAFAFAYNGSNNYMDELAPATSFPIWQNNQNTDISGVFSTFGAGRSIGVVPSFGGFVNSSEALNSQLRTASSSEQPQVSFAYKAPRVNNQSVPLIKKYAYRPELKKDRTGNYKYIAGGMGIEANNKTDLMAAYLGLFRNISNPQITLSATALANTLVIGAADDDTLTISNTGGALAGPLTFDIAENPVVDWLNEVPTSGSVPTTLSADITVTFSAVGLTAGLYNTTLEITSNDPQNPMLVVNVELQVLEAPVIGVVPDTFDVTLTPDSSTTGIITISNTGTGILDFTISVEGSGEAAAAVNVIGGSELPNAPILAVGKPVPLTELSRVPRSFNPASQEPVDKNAAFLQNMSSGLQPIYNIDAEEIFGGMGTVYGPSGARGRGNIFACTQSTTLTEHRLYLNVTAATTMWFVVYEGLTQSGDYTLISASDVSPSGTGQGWYSSGPVSVPMVAGRFYCIFAQWDAPANYYADQNVTPYPVPASFGSLIAGAGFNWAPAYALPPAAIQNIPTTAFGAAVAYYQTIVTGAGSDWLSFDVTSGQIQSGGSQNVTVTFNPAGLLGGDYYARILVNSNDPLNPQVGIGVHMLVVGQAVVGHSPEPLIMDDTFTGATDVKSLWVKNTGSDTLRVSNIISTNPVFTLNQTQFNVAPPLDSVEVLVTFSPILAGLHEGMLLVESNDPVTPVETAHVQGMALEAPLAVVNPTFQNPVYVAPNDSTDIFINIGNAGGSPLIWTAQLSSVPITEKRINLPSYGPLEQSEFAESSPSLKSSTGLHIEATWDLQFSFDVTAASLAAGNAGAEFDGTYYYSTRWASNLLHKYDLTGALVEEFSIPGVSGLRDLAFDGVFMYGGANANTIYMMDFVTKTLIGSIPSPIAVRNIAYDPVYDGLWVGNWDTPLVLVSKTGSTLATIPNPGLTGMYGSAYDGWTDGGPYLWLFDQGLGAGTPQLIHQLSIATGTLTGVSHDVTLEFPAVAGIAGGLFTAEDIVGGKASIGGVLQGTPDMFFVYELAETAPDWIKLLVNGGSISPSDQFDIPLKIYGNTTPGDTAYVIIYTNDPALPVTSVQVIRTMVVGINEQNAVPMSFDIAQNYPNPFNPTTSIKYQLPQVSDVRLMIYNVLGQKVRTLVNDRIEAGYHSVIWDGRNDEGKAVASGVYIYRFEAGNFSRTMKLMLLK